MATITGTTSINILTGTVDDDTIYGLAGNDTLNGGDGNDLLDGGDGNDRINAGNGDDTLYGGTGNDFLYGQAGNDTAYYTGNSSGFIIYRDNAGYISVRDVGNTTATGQGTDFLYNDVEFIRFDDQTLNVSSLSLTLNGPGWGRAYFYGTASSESINGTQAADVIYGGDGIDTLGGLTTGSAGDDTLFGEGGNDRLYGGEGNDTLDGGIGNDSIYGGNGNDRIIGGTGDDNVYGGAGSDTIEYAANSAGFIIFRDNAGYITIRDMNDTSASGQGIDRLYADETEFAQFSNQTIDILALNLQVGGEGWGVATFNGTAGNDGINGTQAADIMNGGDGNDQLNGSTGSAGNDTLNGENGNDTLNGGEGNDRLLGGAGADVMNGGNGNDYIDGGADVDMVTYFTAGSAVNIDLTNTGAQNTGGGGTDTLVNVENVTGSNYNDIIRGNAGDNRILSASGDDTVYGGDGHDSVEASVGNDTVYGENGDDTLNGGLGDDYLDGGAGSNTSSYSGLTGSVGVTVDLRIAGGQNTVSAGTDTLVNIQNLIGSTFTDTLIGNSGANILNGAAGSDVVYAGLGNDMLIGGSGHDTLYGEDGDDTIDGGFNDDIIDGGAGSNWASYDSASAAVNVSLSIAGVQNTGAAGGNDTLINIQNLRGSQFNDTLTGDATDNIFIGGEGDDTIDGAGGLDMVSYQDSGVAVTVNLGTGVVIAPAQGNDTLISIEGAVGSDFNDTLIGDGANNIFEGGLGNDSIDGAGGNDMVSYRTSTENLTVNLSNAGAQNFGALGIDTLANVESVRTGSGNDTILGTSGDNTLDAGLGSDTVSYANAGAGIILDLSSSAAQNTGGAGTDTLIGFENATGSGFDDEIIGNTGDNLMNGGAGFDTTVLSGNWIDYTITYVAGSYVLVDRRGTDGTDTFTSFERFQFADQTIDVNVPADLLNDAPVDIDFTSETIYNTDAINTLVADMTTVDPDFGDVHTYSIVGGAAAASFYITNDQLFLATAGTPGYDPGDFMEVIVRTTDAAGAFYDEILLVEVMAGSGIITGTPAVDTLVGTAGNDTIYGLASDDTLIGNAGDDTLDGGLGSDTASYATATSGVTVSLLLAGTQDTGGAGFDRLISIENLIGSNFNDTLTGTNAGSIMMGLNGNDSINGGGGNDTIDGGAGNDSMVGGAGVDTLSYATATAGVTINMALTTAQNTVGAGTDTFSGFEVLIGSAFADTLTGTAGNDTINAGNGNDTVAGLAGNDIMDGGAGSDTLNYGAATSAITLNLRLTTAQVTGGAGTDTVSNFENIIGSGFNDVFTMSDANNTIVGGAGTDIITYLGTTSGVTVSLANTGAQNTGGSGTDQISGVENLTGSAFNDTLTGDAANNTISGGDGNDTIEGGTGTDVLVGGNGTDYVSFAGATAGVTFDLGRTNSQNTVGAGTKTASEFEGVIGSAFNDIIDGNNQANYLFGGAGNDTISGAGGADTLEGGAGADILDGENGNDVVVYWSDTTGVNVNLLAGTATGGHAQGDTLNSVRHVSGGAANDVLTGDNNANTLNGMAGNDTLSGGSGVDVLFGGLDNDILMGGAGNDTLNGGGGADVFHFAAGGNVDVIQDFQVGDYALGLGDALDIADILTGFVPGVSNINDYVRFTTSGGNTLVSVDGNGLLGGASFTQIATLSGVTGLTVSSLYADDQIIVT